LLAQKSALRKRDILLMAGGIYMMLACGVLTLYFLGYNHQVNTSEDSWKSRERTFVTMTGTVGHSWYFESLGDLALLADHSYPEGSPLDSEANLALMENVIRSSRSYHQIRILDLDGMEVARVNYLNGKTIRVVPADLQDKSHRPYFQQSLPLQRDQVHVSRLDLNMENNRIEQPMRPVIRFCTPIFDTAGQKVGILVLNFLGGKILDQFRIRDGESPGDLFLLNQDGYFLFAGDPDREWGHLLEGRPRFGDLFGAWDSILGRDSGQFQTSRGLFTFSRLSYLSAPARDWVESFTPAGRFELATEEDTWILVTHVPTDLLMAETRNWTRFWAPVLGGFLLLLVPLSLSWGRTRAQNDNLRLMERVYAQVVRQSGEMIIITDPGGHILYCNEAAEKGTGFIAAEMIGRNPRLFKSGRQPERFYRELWDTILGGGEFRNLFINRRKDGALFYDMKSISPLLDDRGRITHFVSIGRDATADLSSLKREQESTQRIAGGMAHHFGNIMTIISGYAELLQMENGRTPAENQGDYLGLILDASTNAGALLEDIRCVALSSRVLETLENPRDAVEGMLSRYRDHLQGAVAIENRLEDVKCRVRWNADLVERVIRQVLDNARTVTATDGAIHVELLESRFSQESCSTCRLPLGPRYLEISIRDEGPGIPAAEQEKIWELFYTTKESGKLVGITLGLGLPTVRSVMHAHEGHILLETGPEGSCFRLLFPCS